jgi:hypothetical protein
MELLDVYVIGLVFIVWLSGHPFPLRNLKSDLIAADRLTQLSAVCKLLGLLDVCDYFVARVSAFGTHHPTWIVAEISGTLFFGLLFGPAFQSFLSNIFDRKPKRRIISWPIDGARSNRP